MTQGDAASQLSNMSSWADAFADDKSRREVVAGRNFSHELDPFRSGVVLSLMKDFRQEAPADVRGLFDYSKRTDPDDPRGHYRVTYADGESYVLQIKTTIISKVYERAQRVYDALKQNGVLTPQLRPFLDDDLVHSFELNGTQYHSAVTDFREGKDYINPLNSDEVMALGTGLAQLDAAFLKLPKALCDEISEAAASTSRLIHEGCSFASSEEGRALLARLFDVKLASEGARVGQEIINGSGQARPAHGDALTGNLILASGGLAVLDFDNVGNCMRLRGTDRGMAAYRIGLDQLDKFHDGEYDVDVRRRILEEFCEGYNRAGHDQIDVPQLAGDIRLALTYKLASALGQYAQFFASEHGAKNKVSSSGKVLANFLKLEQEL